MKKLTLLYIASAALAITACKKNETDYLFEKPIDERLNESLSSYQDVLVKAPGWRLFVYPQGLKSSGIEMGGFSYYVQFTQDNRVKMVSDFAVEMATTPNESGYRLKALQRPSLFFDTYSYLHVAADPSAAVSQSPTGSNGAGWGSDFTFSFTEAKPTGDTLVLEGNQNFSDALLVKVSAGEIDSALNKGALKKNIDAMMSYVAKNQFLGLPLPNNNKAALSFDVSYKLLSLIYKNEKDELVTLKPGFAFTTRGLWLKDPVTIGGYTFQEILWDQQNKNLFIVSGGNKVVLSSNSSPVVVYTFTNQLGKPFTAVIVPTTPLYGQSTVFASAYATAKNKLAIPHYGPNGMYGLDLGDMYFSFDVVSNRMVLNTYVSMAGTRFLAKTIYNYTISGDAIRFTWVSDDANANAIKSDMAPLLNYLTNDSYKLSAITTTMGFYGQFTSKENPNFYFSGYLQ